MAPGARSWETERIILTHGFGKDGPDRGNHKAKAENGTFMEDLHRTVGRNEWEIELDWGGRKKPVCFSKVWEHGPSKVQRQGTLGLRGWPGTM